MQINENFFILLVFVRGSGVLKDNVKYAVVYTSIAAVFFSFCAWACCLESGRQSPHNKVKLYQIKREFDHACCTRDISEFNNMEPLLNINTTIIQLSETFEHKH